MLLLLIIAPILLVALITVTAEDLISAVRWHSQKAIGQAVLILLSLILGSIIVVLDLEPHKQAVVLQVTFTSLMVVFFIYLHSHIQHKKNGKSKL